MGIPESPILACKNQGPRNFQAWSSSQTTRPPSPNSPPKTPPWSTATPMICIRARTLRMGLVRYLEWFWGEGTQPLLHLFVGRVAVRSTVKQQYQQQLRVVLWRGHFQWGDHLQSQTGTQGFIISVVVMMEEAWGHSREDLRRRRARSLKPVGASLDFSFDFLSFLFGSGSGDDDDNKIHREIPFKICRIYGPFSEVFLCIFNLIS